MQHTTSDLETMEQRFRAHFINSLSGFKSANLIGTADDQGNHNLAIMSSAFHLGANPPLMGLIVRPDVAERHTLDNIRATGYYTINHVHADIVDEAHLTSAKYPRSVSEFDRVGLTPQIFNDFKAPAVKESIIKMGLVLKEEQLMQINGTHLLIGEIVWVDVPEIIVSKDGFIDVAQANTVALSGLDAYCDVTSFRRLPYAKSPIS